MNKNTVFKLALILIPIIFTVLFYFIEGYIKYSTFIYLHALIGIGFGYTFCGIILILLSFCVSSLKKKHSLETLQKPDRELDDIIRILIKSNYENKDYIGLLFLVIGLLIITGALIRILFVLLV